MMHCFPSFTAHSDREQRCIFGTDSIPGGIGSTDPGVDPDRPLDAPVPPDSPAADKPETDKPTSAQERMHALELQTQKKIDALKQQIMFINRYMSTYEGRVNLGRRNRAYEQKRTLLWQIAVLLRDLKKAGSPLGRDLQGGMVRTNAEIAARRAAAASTDTPTLSRGAKPEMTNGGYPMWIKTDIGRQAYMKPEIYRLLTQFEAIPKERYDAMRAANPELKPCIDAIHRYHYSLDQHKEEMITSLYAQEKVDDLLFALTGLQRLKDPAVLEEHRFDLEGTLAPNAGPTTLSYLITLGKRAPVAAPLITSPDRVATRPADDFASRDEYEAALALVNAEQARIHAEIVQWRGPEDHPKVIAPRRFEAFRKKMLELNRDQTALEPRIEKLKRSRFSVSSASSIPEPIVVETPSSAPRASALTSADHPPRTPLAPRAPERTGGILKTITINPKDKGYMYSGATIHLKGEGPADSFGEKQSYEVIYNPYQPTLLDSTSQRTAMNALGISFSRLDASNQYTVSFTKPGTYNVDGRLVRVESPQERWVQQIMVAMRSTPNTWMTVPSIGLRYEGDDGKEYQYQYLLQTDARNPQGTLYVHRFFPEQMHWYDTANGKWREAPLTAAIAPAAAPSETDLSTKAAFDAERNDIQDKLTQIDKKNAELEGVPDGQEKTAKAAELQAATEQLKARAEKLRLSIFWPK